MMNKRMKLIFSKLSVMSLKNKLVIVFSLLMLITVAIIGELSYYNSTRILTDKVCSSAISTLIQYAYNIELLANDVEDISRFTLTNENVQMLLNVPLDSEESQISNQTKVENILINLTNSKKHISLICIERLYDRKRFLVGSFPFKPGLDLLTAEWYKNSIEKNGSFKWINTYENLYFPNNDKYVFSLIRSIVDMDNGKPIGSIIVNIKEQALQELYENTVISKNTQIFIVSDKGEIVSHKNKDMLTNSIFEEPYFHEISKRDSGYIKWSVKGVRQIIIYANIPAMNWKLICIIPEAELVSENKVIGEYTIIIAICSAALFFVISILLSSTISKPISKLIRKMNEFSGGKFDTKVDIKYKDEIGQLGEGFNLMVEEIEKLVNQIYVEQKHLREMELKALQAQINPHFLYNTLDSINWLAQEIKADGISSLAKSLAKFFRISLSKGKDIITLQEEFEHVKSYLTIQNIRYEGMQESEISIEDEILGAKVPKLIIQPLVENAIYHGIKKITGMGKITIRGKKDTDGVLIEVMDNGAGMTLEEIEKLNNSLRNSQQEEKIGYGLRNVHERITLRFGKEYGLTFFKNDGVGIRGEIRLPFDTTLEG